MSNELEPCPFCGGKTTNVEFCSYATCKSCKADSPLGTHKWSPEMGPSEQRGVRLNNTLHVPTVIARLSRQLGVDLAAWLSPCADQLFREHDKPVPWEAEEAEEVDQ